MQEAIISISGLRKSYGEFEAVRGIDLEVNEGEIFSLLGPNGSGKTTTIRMLMGILQSSAGRARIHGLDCFRDRAEVKKHVGYLPDEPVFYDYLRGKEILNFVGEMHGIPRDRILSGVMDLATDFELLDALNDYAVNYSKGMKKKLALICALLHDPHLLILDEPTNGLDPMTTRKLHKLIMELAAKGTSVFFSTHLLDQAEKLSDRVAILNEGELAAVGRLEELRQRTGSDSSLEEIFFLVTGNTHEEEDS